METTLSLISKVSPSSEGGTLLKRVGRDFGSLQHLDCNMLRSFVQVEQYSILFKMARHYADDPADSHLRSDEVASCISEVERNAKAILAAVPTGPARRPVGPTDPGLLTFVELLFFAYRDFTSEADAVLAEFGLGRAHHRVLHFVNRHPGLRVADVLEILKITKQSLARVIKHLIDDGWLVQEAGERDRRQRLLRTTDKGAALARRLNYYRVSGWPRR